MSTGDGMDPPPPGPLVLYAVRNKEGKWFRRKGYGGYGDTWVSEFSKARIYTRTGGARSVVSWFAGHYPEYGAPDLVALRISDVVVLDEAQRIRLREQRAKEKEKRAKERRANENLARAQRDYDKANLESLSKGESCEAPPVQNRARRSPMEAYESAYDRDHDAFG